MLSNTDGRVFLRPWAAKVVSRLPFRREAQDDQRVLLFRRNFVQALAVLLVAASSAANPWRRGDARSENRGFCLKTTAHTAAKKSASMRVRAGQQ